LAELILAVQENIKIGWKKFWQLKKVSFSAGRNFGRFLVKLPNVHR